MEGDGDITRPENMTAFRNFVLESTEKRGLHFLMADGVRAQSPVIPSDSRATGKSSGEQMAASGVIWLSSGLMMGLVSGRVSQWKARRTSRRS